MGPRVQSPSVQSASVQSSRVQASKCPIVQSPSVQLSRFQASRCLESKRPEPKCLDHASRVQLFRYTDCSSFEDIFINFLNTHVPNKTKLKLTKLTRVIKANNHELMTKAHWRAMMTRSRLKNTDGSWIVKPEYQF